MRYLFPLVCLIIVHTPDGKELRLAVEHVSAIRPAEGLHEHVAKGTNSIVFSGGKGYGVIETPAEVAKQLDHCESEQP